MLYPNSFNSDLWIRTIEQTYGYKIFYLNDKGLQTGPAVAETKSILSKPKGISFPFSDHYSFNGYDSGDEQNFLRQAIRIGRERNWTHFEYRGGLQVNNKETSSAQYYLHLLNMKDPISAIHGRLKKRTQRNIRKGDKAGIEVSCSNSRQKMRQFYILHCKTRKRHGIPPQPYAFFKNIYEIFIKSGQGFIAIASLNGTPLSSMIFLMNGKTAIYKFGASSKQGLKERASYKLMWDAICHLKTDYYAEQLDLGRTEVANEGLVLFKDGWATSRLELSYSIYPIKAKTSESRDIHKLRMLFKHCPLPILRLIGTVLYRFAA